MVFYEKRLYLKKPILRFKEYHNMTIKKFDQVARPDEPLSVDNIPDENVKDAWRDYSAKPEYKQFNKHDMIDSMLEKDKE